MWEVPSLDAFEGMQLVEVPDSVVMGATYDGTTFTNQSPAPEAPKTYRELRAAEYNQKSTGEQFEMLYDDAVNQTSTWVDWQTEIKARIAKS